MYNVVMYYLNSFLSCSIKYLTLAFLSRLFTIKIDVFFPFPQVLIPTVVGLLTESQLHDFLIINSRYSCLHNSTLLGITITVDPRIKFGFRKGDCFVKKLSFSRVFLR